MRAALLAVLLAACAAPDPDVMQLCGGFGQIDAPRPHLHYSPHVDTTFEMEILDVPWMAGWTMVDDRGVSYQPTGGGTTTTDGNISTLTFHYDVAPSVRATFSAGYFCNSDTEIQPLISVEFFTDLP